MRLVLALGLAALASPVLAQTAPQPRSYDLAPWWMDKPIIASTGYVWTEVTANRANASAEVEYDSARGWMVGEEGRGVPTIIEMVNLTRLDCTVGSASLMRSRPIRSCASERRCAFRRSSSAGSASSGG